MKNYLLFVTLFLAMLSSKMYPFLGITYPAIPNHPEETAASHGALYAGWREIRTTCYVDDKVLKSILIRDQMIFAFLYQLEQEGMSEACSDDVIPRCINMLLGRRLIPEDKAIAQLYQFQAAGISINQYCTGLTPLEISYNSGRFKVFQWLLDHETHTAQSIALAVRLALSRHDRKTAEILVAHEATRRLIVQAPDSIER